MARSTVMGRKARSDPGSVHAVRVRGEDSPPGFAILAVLLALLILTGILHGTLMLARFQGFAGLAETRVLQARLAAQSGVRLAASDLAEEDLDALIAADTVLTRLVPMDGRTTSTVSVRRLAPEWYWIEAAGRTGLGTGQALRRLAAVYWSLEPVRRVDALRATAEVGEAIVTSAASSIAPLVGGGADPGHAAGVCDPSTGPGPPPSFRFAGMAEPSTVDFTDPPIAASGFASGLGPIPRLGLLDGDALASREDRMELSGGAEGLVAGAGPVTGSPGDGLPGAAHSTLLVVNGSHTPPTGRSRGVLALSGDLELPSGREFIGLALVGGSLTVREGARILGAVRVRGALTVEGGGTIVGSPCTVLEILRDLPVLYGTLPATGGSWIDLP